MEYSYLSIGRLRLLPNFFWVPDRRTRVRNPVGLYCLSPLIIVVILAYACHLIKKVFTEVSSKSEIKFEGSGCVPFGKISLNATPGIKGRIVAVGRVTREHNPSLPVELDETGNWSPELAVCRGHTEYLQFSQTRVLEFPVGYDHSVDVLADGEGYGYICTRQAQSGMLRGSIVKVDTTNMRLVGALDVPQGLGIPREGILFGSGLAFFGTSMGFVLRVSLRLMKLVGASRISSEALAVAVADGAGLGYFISRRSPVTLYQIDLAKMRCMRNLTLQGENIDINDGAVDDDGFGYFGTGESPGRLIKVSLPRMEFVSDITLAAKEISIECVLVDKGGFAYVSTQGWTSHAGDEMPAAVVKIDTSSMKRVAAVVMRRGERELYSAVLDGDGFGYFGTYGSSSSETSAVVKIDLNKMTYEQKEVLKVAGVNRAFTDLKGFAYFVTFTPPSRLVKVALGDAFGRGRALIAEGFTLENSNYAGGKSFPPSSAEAHSLLLHRYQNVNGVTVDTLYETTASTPSSATLPCKEFTVCVRYNLADMYFTSKDRWTYGYFTMLGIFGGFISAAVNLFRCLNSMVQKYIDAHKAEPRLRRTQLIMFAMSPSEALPQSDSDAIARSSGQSALSMELSRIDPQTSGRTDASLLI